MGSINDYAAVLGGKPQRQPLKDAIEQLLRQQGVSFIVLVSERDPFSDPERYAAEIRGAWQVPLSKSVFALFLKTPQRWISHLWISSNMKSTLDESELKQLEQQTEKLAQSGRLRQAAKNVVLRIIDLLENDAELPTQSPTNVAPSYVAFAGLFGLVTLLVLLRWARSFCPQCLKRLHGKRRSGRRLRYCAGCGYNRA